MESTTTRGRIAETFYSIQGEGATAGLPAIFVRLQGCTVGCAWCDTKYSWDPTAARAAALAVRGYAVEVETSGTCAPAPESDPAIQWNVSLKLSGAGVPEKTR